MEKSNSNKDNKNVKRIDLNQKQDSDDTAKRQNSDEMSDAMQPPADSEMAALKADLESAKSLASEFKDKHLRALADMDNMRKRFDRERQDISQYGLERIMSDMLAILDSFELALPEGATQKSNDKVLDGLLMVKKQFGEILSKHGLEPIVALNMPFDPNFHQAIQREDSPDVEKEMVKEEYARGYKLNGRLLRPSIVKVSVPKEKT